VVFHWLERLSAAPSKQNMEKRVLLKDPGGIPGCGVGHLNPTCN
jgi:hypothetical protein